MEKFSLVYQLPGKRNKKPDIGRKVSRKWFTLRARVILIYLTRVTAVKNVSNTTSKETRMRLDKMLSL
jgi:hypothetical protein